MRKGEAWARNELKAVEICRSLDPNLVLMDVRMPEIEVLMVTMHDNKYYMQEAAEAGVPGYVLKDAPRTSLIGAVRRVARDAPRGNRRAASPAEPDTTP